MVRATGNSFTVPVVVDVFQWCMDAISYSPILGVEVLKRLRKRADEMAAKEEPGWIPEAVHLPGTTHSPFPGVLKSCSAIAQTKNFKRRKKDWRRGVNC